MFETLMKTHGDLATKAIAEAKTLRANLSEGESFSAEDQSAWTKWMAEFTENHEEFVRLKGLSDDAATLDAAESLYATPATETLHKGPESVKPEALEVKRKKHHEAFVKYMVGGEAFLSPQEQSRFVRRGPITPEKLEALTPQEVYALMSSVDNLGGFLVPDDFVTELIKEIAGFAVIRGLARSRPTTRDAATFMTVDGGTDPYSSGVSGAWKQQGYVTGGTAPTTQDQPRFGRERVPVHLWTPDVIELTVELIEDSAVNLEAEIRTLLAETRGIDEDSAFINGSGVGQPEGLLNAGFSTINSGGANVQSYAGIVNLWTGLPAQYRQRPSCAWLMNSLTYGLLLQLESTLGALLLNPTVGPYQDITSLFGKQIHFSEFMPDGDTDGNNAILLGDFSYYAIADRSDLRIQRLVERYAPNVGILASARVGGQALKTAPFRLQNVGA